ncbi:MAG TPA: acyltransferase, partial [Flavobacterium sp.]|nr:acyltransferase [Flavobacterium sp.]
SFIQKGYLAVDFFFVLSGFVISANYHKTVKPDINFYGFLIARTARLWPLFLITTLTGFVLVSLKLYKEFGYFDCKLLLTLVLNIFMWPGVTQSYAIDRLFLFNGASWSVFFELLVNIFFFLVLRRLPQEFILGFVVFLGIVLYKICQFNLGLDGGWAWENFYVGLIRVLFGFSAGMYIYFLSKNQTHVLSNRIFLIIAALFLSSFLVNGDWLVDFFIVAVGYPTLVFFASVTKLPTYLNVIGKFLGDISYSVYLWQTPLMIIAAGFTQFALSKKIASFSPYSGFVFLTLLIMFSYLSWKYYEVPVRKYIVKRF